MGGRGGRNRSYLRQKETAEKNKTQASNQKATANNQQSTSPNKPENTGSQPTIDTQISNAEASNSQEEINKGIRDYTRALARYTAGLVVIGCVTIVVLFLQYLTFEKQSRTLDSTDNLVRLQTRPNLVFSRIIFPKDSDRFVVESGTYRNFLTVWTNAGNSPTENAVIRIGCSDRAWFWEATNNWSVKPWSIGPKSDIVLPGCPLTDEEVAGYVRRDSYLYIFGTAKYSDETSTKDREARFCVKIENLRMGGGGTDGAPIPCEETPSQK